MSEFIVNNKDLSYTRENVSTAVAEKIVRANDMLVYSIDLGIKSVDDLKEIFFGQRKLNSLDLQDIRNNSKKYVFLPHFGDSLVGYINKFGQKEFCDFQTQNGFERISVIACDNMTIDQLKEDIKYVRNVLGKECILYVKPTISKKFYLEILSYSEEIENDFLVLKMENLVSTVGKLRLTSNSEIKIHLGNCPNNLGFWKGKVRRAISLLFRKYGSNLVSFSRRVKQPYIEKDAIFELPIYEVNSNFAEVRNLSSTNDLSIYAQNRLDLANEVVDLIQTLTQMNDDDFEVYVSNLGLSFADF